MKMEKSELVKHMVESIAEKNNTIDLDAYAKGCEDMFDYLDLKRIEFNENQDKISNIRSKEDRSYSHSPTEPELIPKGCHGAVAVMDTLQKGDWFQGTEEEYRRVFEIELKGNPVYQISKWVESALKSGFCIFIEKGFYTYLSQNKKTQLTAPEFLRRAENTFKAK